MNIRYYVCLLRAEKSQEVHILLRWTLKTGQVFKTIFRPAMNWLAGEGNRIHSSENSPWFLSDPWSSIRHSDLPSRQEMSFRPGEASGRDGAW